MKKLHVIYIPGLGDDKTATQQKAVNTWKWWGVSSELFQIGWAVSAWEPKFQQLLARIDAATERGQQVALVGASAGAGAAVNAYAARKKTIVGIVIISGKVNHPERIGSKLRISNPAFVSSANAVANSLASLDNTYRARILSRYALADPIVLKSDSRIPGAHNRKVPTVGHALTIATQIAFGAPSFIHFLKRAAQQSY